MRVIFGSIRNLTQASPLPITAESGGVIEGKAIHKYNRLLLVDDDEMFRLSTTALLHISDINLPGNRQFEFITDVIQS